MGALTAIMAGAQAGSAIGGAYMQGQAAKSAANFDAKQQEINSRIADIQAEDAIDRGNKEAANAKSRGRQMIGSQRASLAAQGVDIDSGSAAQVQKDTATMSEIDANTIKSNAWREAWGYKVQASNAAGNAAFTRLAAEHKATNTLLTGGMQAVDSIASSYRRSK